MAKFKIVDPPENPERREQMESEDITTSGGCRSFHGPSGLFASMIQEVHIPAGLNGSGIELGNKKPYYRYTHDTPYDFGKVKQEIMDEIEKQGWSKVLKDNNVAMD